MIDGIRRLFFAELRRVPGTPYVIVHVRSCPAYERAHGRTLTSQPPAIRTTPRSACSLGRDVSSLKFSIPSPGHPDLRVFAVDLHAVYRGHKICIAYGEIKALHVLLPVAVPHYHVGYDGVDPAAHGIETSSHRWGSRWSPHLWA